MVNLYSAEAKNIKWVVTDKRISEQELLRMKEPVLLINCELDSVSMFYIPQ